ncbi:MAG: hypothetical protein ISS93_01195 [Candidatus Aenigmarchaeota archaeon]|nr:hypothetical protein [Candidatus Aenigmarchaeota archaeon]
MLAIISILVGLVGFGWAGWKDLKTTEFPDWVPYSMIAAALILRGAFYFVEGNFSLLINSAMIGVPFLAFGLLLYYGRQWGDGDAWLLGAMGFLFPDGLGFAAGSIPFPFMLLFNFFFVAFIYIVVYSVVIGLKSKKRKEFSRGLKKDVARILVVTAAFAAALFLFVYTVAPQKFLFLLIFPPLLFFLLLFLRYGKFVEKNLFKRRIDVKDLRAGDVPASERWRVLGKKEIQSLQKKGGKMWIKEGVRFSPVFVLTILLMLLYGNLWSTLLQII